MNMTTIEKDNEVLTLINVFTPKWRSSSRSCVW